MFALILPLIKYVTNEAEHRKDLVTRRWEIGGAGGYPRLNRWTSGGAITSLFRTDGTSHTQFHKLVKSRGDALL